MVAKISNYEKKAVDEIALAMVSPAWSDRVLEITGKPIGSLLRMAARNKNTSWLERGVRQGVERGMRKIIGIANAFGGERCLLSRYVKCGKQIGGIRDARDLPLDVVDGVASSCSASHAWMAAGEGVALGTLVTLGEAAGPLAPVVVPAAVSADVVASLTIMSRNTCMVAASYGFDPRDPVVVPHLLAALVPLHVDADDGYLGKKLALSRLLSEAGAHLACLSSRQAARELQKGEASFLVRLTVFVAERLGVVITEKEVAILAPFVGGVLNGTINTMFQRVAHRSAVAYFRREWLYNRYGTDVVDAAIRRSVGRLPDGGRKHKRLDD